MNEFARNPRMPSEPHPPELGVSETEAWMQLARTCNAEDIVDIADQITLLRQNGSPDIRNISVGVGSVVVERLHQGTMAPQLADAYFQQTSGYPLER